MKQLNCPHGHDIMLGCDSCINDIDYHYDSSLLNYSHTWIPEKDSDFCQCGRAKDHELHKKEISNYE